MLSQKGVGKSRGEMGTGDRQCLEKGVGGMGAVPRVHTGWEPLESGQRFPIHFWVPSVAHRGAGVPSLGSRVT